MISKDFNEQFCLKIHVFPFSRWIDKLKIKSILRPNSFEFLDYCIRCSVNINNGSGKGLYWKILRCNSDLGRLIIQGASSLEREKKIVQFSGALPAYAPPCFKKKKNLSPYIKRVLKNLKQGAIIVKKFLTIYIFLLLFCLFLDNEPHSVT